MKAETIAVGSELLLGQIANTNAQIISRELQKIGVDVYFHTCVGDNEGRILEVFETALGRSDVIIFTGGLGPTRDDITKEVVASCLGLPLEVDKPSLDKLREFFQRRNVPMTSNNHKQALIPRGAKALSNNNGTAPGILIKHGSKTVVLLPGPPFELEPMLRKAVIPHLAQSSDDVIFSRIMKFYGLGESTLEAEIEDLLKNQSNPTIAPLAKMGEVTLRLTAKAQNLERAQEIIKPVEEEIKDRIGEYLYGFDDDTPESIVAKLLLAQEKTIALAESCTGGLMSHRLTNVPGISRFFERGVVAYSNQTKIDLLGVEPEVLDKYGAVSAVTAEQMARGIQKSSDTDIGVGITGIAGPGGGSEDKPVGLVYIGYSQDDLTWSQEHRFWGSRDMIKARSVNAALHLVRKKLSFSGD